MPASTSMTIFRDSMDRLGETLSEHGFEYRKSKRTAKRIGQMFDHAITFSTSRSINSIPGHIHFEVKAFAWSEKFGEFRRNQGLDLPINEACLFDCPIENIFKQPPPYIRYDDSERDKILGQVEDILMGDVLTIFELTETPDRLQEQHSENSIACLEPFDTANHYLSYVDSIG